MRPTDVFVALFIVFGVVFCVTANYSHDYLCKSLTLQQFNVLRYQDVIARAVMVSKFLWYISVGAAVSMIAAYAVHVYYSSEKWRKYAASSYLVAFTTYFIIVTRRSLQCSAATLPCGNDKDCPALLEWYAGIIRLYEVLIYFAAIVTVGLGIKAIYVYRRR